MTRFGRAPGTLWRLPCSGAWLTWLVFSLSLLVWSLAHAASAPAGAAGAAEAHPSDHLSDAKATDGVDRGLSKRSIASLVAYGGETGLSSTHFEPGTFRAARPGAGG